MHRCNRCRSVFVHPRPTPAQLEDYYNSTNGAALNSFLCWHGTSQHLHYSWNRALKLAERFVGKGPLLDIGCGRGQFLSYAKNQKWQDLTGIEPSPIIASRAREATHATICASTIENADIDAKHFSVITLWDVLEHIANPRKTLRKLNMSLKPGGLVVISTPNIEGISARVFGCNAHVVMPPEHIFIASRKGLILAAQAEGYTVISIDSIDIRIREWIPEAPETTSRRSEPVLSTYGKIYGIITTSAFFSSVQLITNTILRVTRLGDQLFLVLRRDDNHCPNRQSV